jgi:hypothetical protein
MLQGHGRTTTPQPYRAALDQRYSVASFATLQVLSCLHLPGLCCLCCNLVRVCCDLKACSLVTATTVDEICIMYLNYFRTHNYSAKRIFEISEGFRVLSDICTMPSKNISIQPYQMMFLS